MAYQIRFLPSASRSLKKLSIQVVHQLQPYFDQRAHNPRPPGCKKLRGKDNLWRVRAGDYRIIYQIDDGRLIVVVVALGHRKDIYQ